VEQNAWIYFSDYTRPVRYFRSTQVSLLLLFIGNRKIRCKDNKSLCSTVVKLWKRHRHFSQLTVGFHQGEWRLEQESSKIHWMRVIGWRSDNRTGPSRCGAQCKTWARGTMQDLGAGPLSNDFMTSSCSVNHVTIVVERRYAVQHQHENWARLPTFERKFASSDESVLC